MISEYSFYKLSTEKKGFDEVLTEISKLETSHSSSIFSDEDLRKILLSEHGRIWCGVEGRLLVAYLFGQGVFPEFEIYKVLVRSDLRRCGIGHLILSKVVDDLEKEGFKKCFLEVNEKNEGAIQLYEKHGFIPYSVRKKYYNLTDNAVLMKLVW